MDDDRAGSCQLLVFIDSIESGWPAVHNNLELQLLNVDTGRTVANFMDGQLRHLVCEDLEQGHQIGGDFLR